MLHESSVQRAGLERDLCTGLYAEAGTALAQAFSCNMSKPQTGSYALDELSFVQIFQKLSLSPLGQCLSLTVGSKRP